MLEDEGRIAAYFCLLDDKVTQQESSNNKWKKLKKGFPEGKQFSSYPAIKIGRFAVSSSYRGLNLGTILMGKIKKILLSATYDVFAQDVTINAHNRNAESVFAELMQQTGKNFIYTAGLLNGVKVSVQANCQPLTKVLDKMFEGTGIIYKIKGNNVTLTKKKVKSVPKHTISGFVREEGSGEALVGATVYDSQSGKVTVTNANGFYSECMCMVATPMRTSICSTIFHSIR